MITKQCLVIHFYYFSNKRKIPSKKVQVWLQPSAMGKVPYVLV